MSLQKELRNAIKMRLPKGLLAYLESKEKVFATVRSRRCSWIRQKKLPIIRSAGVQFLVAFEFGGGGLSVAMVAG